MLDEDLLNVAAVRLGCEPTAEAVGHEIARLIELAEALDGIAEALSIEKTEHASSYVEAVEEMQIRLDELEDLARLGSVLQSSLGLSDVSVHLVARSSDPEETIRRELRLMSGPASHVVARASSSVLQHMLAKLGASDGDEEPPSPPPSEPREPPSLTVVRRGTT